MLKGKRGWVRIVEAFVAVLLIAGVLLIVIDKGYLKRDFSEEVYRQQGEVLREIQLDESLREDILKISETEVNESVSLNDFPINVKNKIQLLTNSSLDCDAKVCRMDVICALDSYPEKDVYSRSVAITANSDLYAPRQLKLFCSVK
jgi:hypothetical protein